MKKVIHIPVLSTQKFRVWWIPQLPMPSFRFEVGNLVEAKLLMDALAKYDQFQLDHRIKPDYCNAGGVQYFLDDRDDPENSGWVDWHPEDTVGFTNAVAKIFPDVYLGDEALNDLSMDQLRAVVSELAS